MRYFVRFAYYGTDYHGSQRQPNANSVQQTMEEAFSTIFRHPVALTFAGRTDAGVHARQMWAHFDTDTDILFDRQRYLFRFNSLLPSSIAIDEILAVQPTAHARFDAISRTYEYHIITCKSPFLQHLATRVACGLDFEQMNRAAQLLLGTHDFACFCKLHTDVKTTICTVSDAHWQCLEDNRYVFIIKADRFLRNMVRAVVGTLFEVGRGKISLEQFQEIINSKNRSNAGDSVPSDGLYLVEVDYPMSIFTT